MKIEQIIILTMMNLACLVPDLDNCFELFGFDVMVDSTMKPWLLEVNSSPAMSMDNQIDYKVKPDLLRDTLKLVHFENYGEYVDRHKSQQRVKPSVPSFFTRRPGNSGSSTTGLPSTTKKSALNTEN